jgi:hypothetical protein
MIKMIKPPAIIQQQSRKFKNLFKNKVQFKHFKEYVTGLMLCENKTFRGIQAKYVDAASSINSLYVLGHNLVSTQ